MQTMENINECTKTKTILNILGPIAHHIIKLKTKMIGFCDSVVVVQLLKLCDALLSSGNHLIEQLISHASSTCDESLIKIINDSSLDLSNSMHELISSTRKLQKGDLEARSNVEVWCQILKHTEKLFDSFVIALLSCDKYHIGLIFKSLDTLTTSLNTLKEQKVIENVSQAFKDVVNNAVEAFSLISNRCEDICSKQQKEMLHMLCLQLHAIFPLLSSVTANCVVHPNNKLLKANQTCVLSKIFSIISDLKIQSGMGSSSYDLQIPASFINTIDGLFDLIKSLQSKCSGKNINSATSFVKTLKGPCELILKYAIGLAQSCTKLDKDAIMNASESVLHQIKVLSDFEKEEMADHIDIEVTLDVLSDVLELLELRVNTALIRLIVQAFADPFSALEELLCFMKNIGEEADVNFKETDMNGKIDSLIKTFEDELDIICQIGNFTIACTADADRARKIECSLATLEWLESILIPTVISAVRDHNLDLHMNASVLGKQWVAELVNLRNIIDLSMDPSAFCLVTKQEVHLTWANIRLSLNYCEYSWLKQQIKKVSALTRRILTLDRASLFLYDLVRDEIKTALAELNKYQDIMNNCELSEEQRPSLLKRVQVILTILSNLATNLNQEHFLRSECEELIYGEDLQSRLPQYHLSDSQKNALQTSFIKDVPVDVSTSSEKWKKEKLEEKDIVLESNFSLSADISKNNSKENKKTPVNGLIERPLKLLRRTPKAGNRSEELLSRIEENGIKRQLFQESLESGGNESKTQYCDVSIDITKFLLSRSVSAFRNSERGSKRNFSLKVKEMKVDISQILNLENKNDECLGNAGVRSEVLCKPVNAYGQTTELSVDDLEEIMKHLKTLPEGIDISPQETDDQTTEPGRRKTFAGKESEKTPVKFHSYEALLPVNNETNSSTSNSTESNNLSKEKISQNTNDILLTNKSEVLCSSLLETKEKKLSNPNSVESSAVSMLSSKNVSQTQTSGASTLSSINISTPQRLGDLKAIHKRLRDLKALFR